MTQEYLWGFLQKQGFVRSPIELYGEMELLWLLDQFLIVRSVTWWRAMSKPGIRNLPKNYARNLESLMRQLLHLKISDVKGRNFWRNNCCICRRRRQAAKANRQKRHRVAQFAYGNIRLVRKNARV